MIESTVPKTGPRGKILSCYGGRHPLSWCPTSPRYLATGSGGSIILIWEFSASYKLGRLLHMLAGHSNPISSLAWSADGSRLASASVDGGIKLWDPVGGNELLELRAGQDKEPFFHQIAFSPNEYLLAATNAEGSVDIWDAKSKNTTMAKAFLWD